MIRNLIFAAAGASSTVTPSPGTSWTYNSGITSGGGSTTNSIIYANSQFKAITSAGLVPTSATGATWTVYAGTGGLPTNYKIKYLNGKYYTVGLNSSAQPSIADDTIGQNAWSQSNLNTPFSGQFPRDITYYNSKFYVVGDGGKMATSTNGLTWTASTGISSLSGWGSNSIRAIETDGTNTVAVGISGKIAYTSNGTIWNMPINLPFTNQIYHTVKFVGSFVVAIATTKCAYALASDLSIWYTGGTIPITTSCAEYGNGYWIVGGVNGTIATSSSPNGLSWTSQGTALSSTSWGSTNEVKSIAYGNGTWVAVGFNGACATST